MTYIQVNSHYLFAIYLDYIKTLKKIRDKTKMIFRRQKNQNKIYKCAKNRIK